MFDVQFCDNSTTFDISFPLFRVAKRFHRACFPGPASLLFPRKEAAKSSVGPERAAVSFVCCFHNDGICDSTSAEDFSIANIWSPAKGTKEARGEGYLIGVL